MDALQELFRSECNCAYWHGVFGGSYLPHLRRSLWHYLLKAERALPVTATIEKTDLKADGSPVVRIETTRYSAHVKPGVGGALLSFDVKEKTYPLLDVLAQRREA